MSCVDACRRLGYGDAIEYGISIKYARTRNWGEWEVFREFMQNALDEEHYVRDAVPTEYLCIEEPGRTVIYDHGRGISVDNLLLGESRKERWQRGMFGEGMKIAMIAALLLGLKVRIRSRDKEIMPISVERVYEDTPVQVLCACIKKGLEPVEGTRVIIEGAEMCNKYRRHVVQGIRSIRPDCTVLHIEYKPDKKWYDVVDASCSVDSKSSIYVRDLYVASFDTLFKFTPNALYSYNLFEVMLDESRKIPNSSSVHDDMENILVEIINRAPTDKKAREVVERIIVEGVNMCREKWEYARRRDVNMESSVFIPVYMLTPEAQKLVKEIFEKHFGKDAVVVASMGEHLKASYLGLAPILCNEAIAHFLDNVINFKKKMIEQQVGMLHKVIDVKKELPQYERLFDVLLKMASIITPDIYKDVKILFAVLDPDKPGQSTSDGIVLVNILHLLSECSKSADNCVEHWMATIVHELAHIKCWREDKKECEDTTKEYILSITKFAGYALRVVMERCNEYYSLLKELIEARKATLGYR
jgi:hypothetical protein